MTRASPQRSGGASASSGLVTFSSDYGPAEVYVGICHLVIARIAPNVRVVDLTHGMRGVRGAASILERSLSFAPAGIHLAIVDPGVGTDRRGVVVTTGDGSSLVGPDNGLLPPAAEALGGAAGVFELTNPEYRLEPVSATFHGRDVFAPAAAHLALGVPPERFGTSVDPGDLVRLPPPHVETGEEEIVSDVVRADWFGNLVLAASADDLERSRLRGRVSVSGSAGAIGAHVGRTFADVAPGELVVYVDSSGQVAIACNGGSARETLGDPEQVRLSAP